MTEGWICPDGHPLYLIDGEKICAICAEIERNGARPNRCKKRGHTVPRSAKNCRVCQRYRHAPWWEVLDTMGSATCPSGHEVTHEDLLYGIRSGGIVERKCHSCVRESWSKAHDVFMKRREEVAAAEGRELRHRDAPKKRLPIDYFDWVVSLRLIEGKIDEVYDMRRGEHVGATAMEKWVAYHSTGGDYFFTRKFDNSEKHVREQWPDVGLRKGWPPKTLAQAMSEL